MNNIPFGRAALFLAWTFLALVSGNAQQLNADIENIGNRDINAGLNEFVPDLESEIALGRQAAAELEGRTKLIGDPRITEYVDNLAQHIVRNSDARFPFTIKVIDSDSIDAIALPGGFLYVTRGMIAAAESEAELAGLLAHQVAHVTTRQVMERQGKLSLVNVKNAPSLYLPFSIFQGGIPAAVVQEALAMGVPVTFVAFPRRDEEEADWIGLQYMIKAGYDPAAMPRFLGRLQTQEDLSSKVSSTFRTHPQSADRVRMAQEHIASLPAVTTEFQRVKTLLGEGNK